MDAIFGIINVIAAMSTAMFICLAPVAIVVGVIVALENQQGEMQRTTCGNKPHEQTYEQDTAYTNMSQVVRTLSFGRTDYSACFLDLFDIWKHYDPDMPTRYARYLSQQGRFGIVNTLNCEVSILGKIICVDFFNRDVAVSNGIESALDAYFTGVPVEDILA